MYKVTKTVYVWFEQSCSVSKETFDLTVTRGRFGLTKYDDIDTFEQIVEPKCPSGNCQVNFILTDRTALGSNFYESDVITTVANPIAKPIENFL